MWTFNKRERTTAYLLSDLLVLIFLCPAAPANYYGGLRVLYVTVFMRDLPLCLAVHVFSFLTCLCCSIKFILLSSHASVCSTCELKNVFKYTTLLFSTRIVFVDAFAVLPWCDLNCALNVPVAGVWCSCMHAHFSLWLFRLFLRFRLQRWLAFILSFACNFWHVRFWLKTENVNLFLLCMFSSVLKHFS